MKERFDIVDRNDQVIGTTDKETAHREGQLHRVAAVFVFTPTGELYIQEHKSDRKWDNSVGGHVRAGESYAQAAVREAKEELGITDELTELATSIHGPEYPHMQHFFGLYMCTPGTNWQFIPNDEVDTIIPLPVPEIVSLMQSDPDRFTKGFLITMAKYREWSEDNDV